MTKRMVGALLTAMDGVSNLHRWIVIGATNRLEQIDPALRRPGRFDRELEIGDSFVFILVGQWYICYFLELSPSSRTLARENILLRICIKIWAGIAYHSVVDNFSSYFYGDPFVTCVDCFPQKQHIDELTFACLTSLKGYPRHWAGWKFWKPF